MLRSSGMDDHKVKLGVLWSKVSREGGRKYLSGAVRLENLDAAVELMRAGGRFLVLSVLKKRPDKQDPDCELFVVPAGNGAVAAAPPASKTVRPSAAAPAAANRSQGRR